MKDKKAIKKLLTAMECGEQVDRHYKDTIREICSAERSDITVGFELGVIFNKMTNEIEANRQTMRDIKKALDKKEKKKQEKHDKKWIKTD